MECICKPWRGYHRDECPCQAAYEEIREAELEKCDLPETEVQELASQLVAEGWQQQSRKYRRVVKVPSGSSALAELERLMPEEATRLREIHARQLESSACAALWHKGETKELPLRVFEAFRAAVKHVRGW